MSDKVINFYDFAKAYIIIKDGLKLRSLNQVELAQMEEMQKMIDKGYELRLVRLRQGSKVLWCKVHTKKPAFSNCARDPHELLGEGFEEGISSPD